VTVGAVALGDTAMFMGVCSLCALGGPLAL
jgi:hypothetical protein